ncbi:hypothetical protein KYLE_46 [Pantoea phage Kyle]|uniref:Uncharacterized protein n=1 Tax=Pantoea phage Kyle TaxID=2589665 RepID=A0A514A8J8_9CAUD|nr:tail fiber protein [Pantoea phage Kyle]QDH49592.1 hypothetical protein KYLE_46 [Pantoea phage Kyle]
MVNISGYGMSVNIVALQTFPMGFSLESFSDDADPLAIDDTEVAGYEMTFDGGLVAFDKAAAHIVNVSVIPNSEDDINLKLLLQARKSSVKWLPIQDVTTMVINYPERGRVVFSNGTILKGPFADSILSTGRRRSNTYTFAFGAFAGAQTTKQAVIGTIQSLIGLI